MPSMRAAGVNFGTFEVTAPKALGVAADLGSTAALRGQATDIFMMTDNAHLISLNRFTGELEWETELADLASELRCHFCPLVAGDLVISGTAGGESGARGFLAAFDQATGKEVWRFWTVPAAWPTWLGDLERKSHCSRRRRHLVYRIL